MYIKSFYQEFEGSGFLSRSILRFLGCLMIGGALSGIIYSIIQLLLISILFVVIALVPVIIFTTRRVRWVQTRRELVVLLSLDSTETRDFWERLSYIKYRINNHKKKLETIRIEIRPIIEQMEPGIIRDYLTEATSDLKQKTEQELSQCMNNLQRAKILIEKDQFYRDKIVESSYLSVPN